MKRISIFILIIAVIALVFAFISGVEKSNSSMTGLCTIANSDCAAVQNTIYGQFYGIDLPVLGVIGFLIIAGLAVWQIYKPHKKKLYVLSGLCILAGIFALWLIYVQAFILQQFCALCIVVDGCSVILLGLGIYALAKQ
ncbi:vitamin K epoxide reductase family protein [Candidatus Woesearchaeota archaeon]|nr:MAG: vitamin K epoxide reductase family protein [Candidatus Woesearchaeota archaeon]